MRWPYGPLIAASLLLCAGCGKDEPTAPQQPKQVLTDNPLVTSTDSLVDRALRPFVAGRAVAGVSLAVIDGGQAHLYGYGETRLGNGVRPDTNTVYEIGSLTKSFTAAATLSWLASRGLGLDSPVEVALPAALAPGLEAAGVKATFRELLDHTSGLPRLPADFGAQPGYQAGDPYRGYDSTRVLAYIASHVPVRTPGTRPTTAQVPEFYSNLAYGLAGIILERQGGSSYQSVIADRVCAPLGMGATTAALPSANLAFPHDDRGSVVPFWELAGFAGAGALHSSLHDMTLYALAQLGPAPGDLESILTLCQTPSVTVDGRDVFGLGWGYYYLADGRRITVHDGGTGGSTAFIAFDRSRGRALVWLSNNAPAAGSAGVFTALMESFFTP
jgi:CubicO group peptidase (beta-lactamase class C family)